ncbi:Coagulation factor X, partial [Orchesella cincta]
ECGVPDSQHSTKVVGRIVGGNAMKPGESPWTAAIVKKNSNRPFCGASLLNNLYLLTAAHCVLNQTRKTRDAGLGLNDENVGNKTTEVFFDVLLNEHDISLTNEIAGGTIRAKVKSVIIHPKYNNVTFDFDAALIRLAEPVDFNPPEVTRSSSSSRKYRYPYSSFDFHSLVKRKKRFILPEIQARAIPPKPIPVCLPEAGEEYGRNGKNIHLENDYAVVTGWGLVAEGKF